MIHVNHLQGAEELREQLCSVIPCPGSILTAEFTPGLSVHAGTGVVGVVVLTAK
jgi:fatty acid-binding protein DegV